VGEQALEGLEIAAAGATPSEEPLSIVVRDTEGADVARLVDDLVEREHVAAIVGPLDAASAEVAAGRAAERGVPLLALTIRPGVGRPGSPVFRPFQSNEAEVAALVGHAVLRLGRRTFAVLHPEGSYGRVVRRLAEEEVARRGGELVASLAYDATQTSFVEVSQQLASQQFDALVVAGSSRSVALIAPALAAAGLWSQGPAGGAGPSGTRPVQLLLTAAAFDEGLIGQAGRYLQGALFATPFFAHGSSPSTAAFVERFQAAHGRLPTAYASQAHDAAAIVRAARSRAETPTREAVLEALRALDSAGTAGPFTGFDENGEPRSPVLLVTVDGEAWMEVSR
jgi:branched-chain amino acid transport system substrate-binding protein